VELDTALNEYELLERRRKRGEEAQIAHLGMAALREYLLTFSELGETAELREDTLFEFLFDYYPREEDPEREVGAALLEVVAGFAQWLVEREVRSQARFVAATESLRKEVPRVLAALAALREHVSRDSLASGVEAELEGGEEPTAVASTGLDRVARLDQVDYDAAEEEYFHVRQITPAGLQLYSLEREALGEGLAGPVRLPVEAASLLRPGDIIRAEIAPAADGWELLEVFSVRPPNTA
jgi:hypothetical protein